MPTYTFTGKNLKGAKVTGERNADSKVALTQLLRKEQIIPQVIKEKVKEASGNVTQMCEVCAGVPPEFIVLSGDDALTLPLMAIGGHGIISVAGNEIPGEMVKMVEAAERNDFAAAREIHARHVALMLINFMYTSCDRVCPRVTQNLAKVQRLLGSRMGHDIFFYSFTLDPTHDTPEVLKDYAKAHGVGPGWSFLTGPAGQMEMLRKRLGFTDPDPELDKDRESHIGNVRYGNEARLLWGACPGMSRAEFIVESLSWIDWPKGQKPA